MRSEGYSSCCVCHTDSSAAKASQTKTTFKYRVDEFVLCYLQDFCTPPNKLISLACSIHIHPTLTLDEYKSLAYKHGHYVRDL